MNSKIKRVLVTGATGNIGYNVCLAVLESEIELFVLGRKTESNFRQEFSLPCKYFQWNNPQKTLPPVEAMDVDAVIHLMGEPLDGNRWTEQKKLVIRSSRINSTKNIVNAIENSLERIKIFITASAIGIYGDKAVETLTESSIIGNNFLSKLASLNFILLFIFLFLVSAILIKSSCSSMPVISILFSEKFLFK